MNGRSNRTITVEALIVVALLAIGIGMRVAHLEWPPLGAAESAAALDAARSTRFASALDPSSGPAEVPSYAAVTALLFTAFGATTALARTLPALAGAALLFLPLLLRRELRPAPAVLTLLLLALSPVLVMVSRTAGGEAIAIAAVGGAFALLLREDLESCKRATWVAALLALALASGPSALLGLLGIGLGFVLHRLLFRSTDAAWREVRTLPWSAGRELVLLLVLLAVFATGAATRLDGIAGLAASLAAWIRGWMYFGDLSLGPALMGAILAEPLVLAGGAYAALVLRGQTKANPSLLAWALGALIVMIAYPGRTEAAVAWCVVPLALLAGQAAEDIADRVARAEHKPVLFALIGLLLLLVVFAYLQLSAYARGIGLGVSYDPMLGLGLAIGALILGIVIAVLFGLGWSWGVTADAARAVVALLLLAQTISAGWSLNYNLAATARELLRPQAATIETEHLLETVRGVSMAQTGTEDDLPLRLEDRVGAVLAWTLRGFPVDRPQGALAADQPPVILRRVDGQDRPLAADYVGQTFTIAERKGWTGILPSGLLHWLVLRDAPTTPEQWLLLVRADVAGFGESPAPSAADAAGG